MEFAVIGNKEFVIGFQRAGVRTPYPADPPEKLTAHITRV